MADKPGGVSQSCTFIKKRFGRKQNTRKRKASGSGGSSDEDSNAVIRKDKKIVGGALFHSSSGHKVKQDVDYGGDNDQKETTFSYKSSGTAKRDGPQDMGATAIVEIDTSGDKDDQAIFERAQEINKELKGKEEDHVYRGINNYQQFYEKRDTAAGNASSGMVRKGPIRAPAHLRATVRWDYQPDICKDYKETGFCGFGDSCKFMHDRGDYKHGWQLEREEGETQDEDVGKYEISDGEDELPFKCILCRKSFTNPVITKCKHYFCEKCALDQYRKSKRCFVCNQQTMGVFNPAKEIIARINKMKQAGEKIPDSDSGEEEDASDDKDQ